MASKQFHEMTQDELQAEFDIWSEKVRTAPGWPSAYFAARCLAEICRLGGFENPHPITVGQRDTEGNGG